MKRSLYRISGNIGLSLLALVGAVAAIMVPSAHASALSSVQFQLGPTYPSHTGIVPTTAVDQDTSIWATLDYGVIGWKLIDYPIDVDLVEVHHLDSAATCSQARPITTVYTNPGDSVAERDKYVLSLTFQWPASATSVAGGSPYYAVCLHQRVPSSMKPAPDILSGDASAIGTNAVYEVLGDFAPTISLSKTSVPAGQSITITGRHWNYYQRTYSDIENNGTYVRVMRFNGSEYYLGVGQTPVIDTSGNFTVTLVIPRDYQPATYYATVGNAMYRIYEMGFGLPFHVLAPTSVPQPSPSVTAPTPGATTTATTIPTAAPSVAPRVQPTPGTQSIPSSNPVPNADETPGNASPPITGGGAVAYFGVTTLLLAGACLLLARRRTPTALPR